MGRRSALTAVFAGVVVAGLLSNASASATTTPAPTTTPLTCKLTQAFPTRPAPSLTQCYKYNTESCCVAGHDQKIKVEYKSLLSATCLREFPELEFYYCLGCHPEQSKYIGEDEFGTPIVKVCETYANQLFEKGYSNCGLNLLVDNPLVTADNPVADWNMSFIPSDTRQVVMPHHVFENATEFLNAMKPPYFEGYTIVIEPGNIGCFTSAASVLGSLQLTSVMFVMLTTWKTLME